jgi:hypothetical protein
MEVAICSVHLPPFCGTYPLLVPCIFGRLYLATKLLRLQSSLGNVRRFIILSGEIPQQSAIGGTSILLLHTLDLTSSSSSCEGCLADPAVAYVAYVGWCVAPLPCVQYFHRRSPHWRRGIPCFVPLGLHLADHLWRRVGCAGRWANSCSHHSRCGRDHKFHVVRGAAPVIGNGWIADGGNGTSNEVRSLFSGSDQSQRVMRC